MVAICTWEKVGNVQKADGLYKKEGELCVA